MQGHVISPASNVVSFVCNEEKSDRETIISEKEAKRYSLRNVFPDWKPEKMTKKLLKQSEKIKKTYL